MLCTKECALPCSVVCCVVLCRYRYPPFCYGPSYFFSSDLLPHLFNATLHVNFFKLEDVYMGLCIEHAGKSVQTIRGVSNVSPKYSYCAYKDLALVHGIEPTKWSMYFRDIAKRAPQNIICPKKVRVCMCVCCIPNKFKSTEIKER